jgi:hypothetical protein
MAKLTRLASTVTARYFPASDLTDAFYLDGRLSGKREGRAADITVDKEDRGFFFSVFSHSTVPGRDPAAEQVFEAPLRKLFNEIKTGRKALDDEIGDLVNTAVAVTGRMKLQADNARTPFFAGALVKDSEAFAITMGKGLAFLYRDDTLFPLTATDLQIDPVNTQRQKVDNFYNYCAAKTATALCSNIAQLKMDDCLILCNREIYEALGQQEILRILYDAEDQCDAAGTVITEASAKLPGVPLQFMISFVESVSAQEKPGLFGLGRKNRQNSYNDTDDEAIEVPIAKTVAAAAPVPAPNPAAAAVPKSEPLYFGNDATDPGVLPLAEQPVTPNGPQDPIHFQDDSLEPFGDPIHENKAVTDGNGFVVTEFEDTADKSKPTEAYIPEEEIEEAVEDIAPLHYQQETLVAAAKNAPQYVSKMSDYEEEGDSLVFGDDTAPVSSKTDAGSSGTGTYYIPFESKEPAAPATTNIDDIPDMPLYDAPTYSPPTYPTNSYTPKGYDNSGIYARGSYSLDDDDSDMNKDIPSQSSSNSRAYSYTPPQQTVPSYGGAPDQRAAYINRPPRSGQPIGGQPMQQPRPRPNQASRSSQDVFDQDRGFDYGDVDTAYKRNKIWMGALAVICVVCAIILAVVLLTGNNKSKTPSVSTSLPSATLSTGPSGSGAATGTPTTAAGSVKITPTAAPNATVAPVAKFYFSDQTGFRTWWDLFYYAYQLKLSSNTDPRIAIVIKYNGLASDYVPKPGDAVNVPPLSLITGTATATATPTPAV